MGPADFLTGVIRPTLQYIAENHPDIRHDESVENLLLATALHESGGLDKLFQIGGGPALGVYQIEPNTHESIWDNYLAYRPDLASTIRGLASQESFTRSNDRLNNELVTNLAYATAIARLIYLPKPGKIPDTLQGQANYWKTHYNTEKGEGTTQQYIASWTKYI
jgi:hypothetical protein|tara:strand:- start:2079 stop:2570 length:492 start_codon:yes stop_codon:yes gene_type:complete